MVSPALKFTIGAEKPVASISSAVSQPSNSTCSEEATEATARSSGVCVPMYK